MSEVPLFAVQGYRRARTSGRNVTSFEYRLKKWTQLRLKRVPIRVFGGGTGQGLPIGVESVDLWHARTPLSARTTNPFERIHVLL